MGVAPFNHSVDGFLHVRIDGWSYYDATPEQWFWEKPVPNTHAINQTTADAGDARGRARRHVTPLLSIFEARDPGTSAGTVYLRMPFIKKSYLEEDTSTSLTMPFLSMDRKN